MIEDFKALLRRLKRLEPHRFYVYAGHDSSESPPLPAKLLSKTEQVEHKAQSELKQELLEHYAKRNPSSFFQFDAFTDVEADEYMLAPDDEGDSVMSSVTHELMTGMYAVRLLVTPGTSPEKTCALLGKMSEMIAERGFDFNYNALERQIDYREAKHNRSDANSWTVGEYEYTVPVRKE